MTQQLRRDAGFTLIELMVVLAILSILATIALVSHRHFLEKARAVEAEVALAEIDRLETLYHANHGTYSSDFTAIGFTLSPMLKYHKVLVQLQNGGTSFQATATPLSGTKQQVGLVLTHRKDGTTLQKADLVTLAAQGRSPTGSSPTPSSSADQQASTNPTKVHCKDGGEATVAQDGLLDMNFCLK